MYSLKRQVVGSHLVDSVGKLETLEQLLSVPRGSLQLTALFATQDKGWDPAAFHSNCDNKGPTLTLVQCTESAPSNKRIERLYGGYAAVSWNSSNLFQNDAQAFLFRFVCPKDSKKSVAPEKFSRTSKGNEVFGSSSMGPVFGYKHDFFTFDKAADILSEKQHGNINSFTLEGQPLVDAAHIEKSRDKWRLEVLHVGSIDPAAGELDVAWQKGVSWSPEDGRKLQDKVLSFDPRAKRLPVDSINILLCGGVGAGKSSFVSTIDSLCEGRTSRLAPHGTGTGSLTRNLRKYTFTDPATDQLVHWKLWDSMGWGANDYKQGELNYILDGNLPDGCDLDRAISAQTPGFRAQPTLGDRVHSVCMVVPCDSATDESYMKRLCEMRQFARARDLIPLVLLTKIDSYDPDVIGEDLTKTFHSARLLNLMKEVAHTSGVGGRKDVLPIKNFCDESEPTTEAGQPTQQIRPNLPTVQDRKRIQRTNQESCSLDCQVQRIMPASMSFMMTLLEKGKVTTCWHDWHVSCGRTQPGRQL
ncbi:hypothetical protein WJX77_001097 [Trebouxia sp. C0004]